MRAALVLRLVDSVTGEACTRRGFTVSCPPCLRPVWKHETGILVLVAYGEGPLRVSEQDAPATVTVSSPEFLPHTVEVPAACDSQVRTCVLYPTRAYVPATPVCCIEGAAEPHAWLQVVDRSVPAPVFLAEDIPAGAQRIALLSDHAPFPTALALMDGEHEHVTRLLREPDTPDAVELCNPPARAYARRKTALFRAWETRADDCGRFALFLAGLSDLPATVELTAPAPDGAMQTHPVGLARRGERIWCDLRG